MATYTNRNVYIVLKTGSVYPTGVAPASLGEGANSGVLKDGRGWFKNCLLSPDEMRRIVHAEDAGKLELKTAEQMRTILDKEMPEAIIL